MEDSSENNILVGKLPPNPTLFPGGSTEFPWLKPNENKFEEGPTVSKICSGHKAV